MLRIPVMIMILQRLFCVRGSMPVFGSRGLANELAPPVFGSLGIRGLANEPPPVDPPISTPTPGSQQVDFTASFEIYTNGTRRIFIQAMYHRQSPNVYIENPDPGIVHIKKSDTTWNDFFKTLPFSVTKDCLITGTKQTFCSNETQKLRFFLNGVENLDVLDHEIKANDSLKITYGN